ncbi:hypothetical protein ABZS78_36575, partial [Streptomyces decoyicus]
MDTTTVAAFLAVDLLLVCTPGADWAYAITAGLRDRSVLPAVVWKRAPLAATSRCDTAFPPGTSSRTTEAVL